ncbi:MAG: T9SS type A sorting domain-containing protein [Chitinophagales bacterium]
MTLRFLITTSLCLLIKTAFSQAADLFYNQGDLVFIQSGALLHVQGGLTNKNFGSGSKSITNNGIIEVEGNVNLESSTTYTDGGSGERVLRLIGGSTMPGSSTDQTIFTGNNPIHNLVIDRETNANEGVRLLSDVEVKGSLVWGSKTTGSATFTAYTGTNDQVRGANRSSGFGVIRTYNGTTDYTLYVSNGAVNAVVGYQTPSVASSDALKFGYVETRGASGVGLGGFSRSVTATNSDYYFPVGTSTNTYQALKLNFNTVGSAPNIIRGMFVDNAAGFGTITKKLDCTNSNFSGYPGFASCNAGTYTMNGQFVLDNNGYNVYGPNPCTGKNSWYIFEKTPTNHGYWSFTGNSANVYTMEVFPRSYSYTGSTTEGARVLKHNNAGIGTDPSGDDWTNEIYSSVSALGDLFRYSKWPASGGGNTNSCSTSSGATGIPGGKYTGFSHFGFGGPVASSNPLPVSLLFLRAQGVNNSFIRLNWATATEINNKGFEIMRSEDGANFSRIGWMEGHGNSATTLQYSYDDHQVQPNTVYYYKLNQIDIDGHNKETYTVSAKITDGPDFAMGEFVPNPTIGKTTLSINTSGTQPVEVKFYNMLGAEVLRTNFTLEAGNNDLQFDTDVLAAATYNAVIRVGTNIFSKKLVVSR